MINEIKTHNFIFDKCVLGANGKPEIFSFKCYNCELYFSSYETSVSENMSFLCIYDKFNYYKTIPNCNKLKIENAIRNII